MNEGIYQSSEAILLQNKALILLRKEPLAFRESIDFVLSKELTQEPLHRPLV
jgi:hypothetical protein